MTQEEPATDLEGAQRDPRPSARWPGLGPWLAVGALALLLVIGVVIGRALPLTASSPAKPQASNANSAASPVETDPNWIKCESDDTDIALEGCTAVIASGKETPANLAVAYNNRAYVYDQRKQYDLALPDYNQALALNPNYPEALNGRGHVYYDKFQTDLAVADFTKAIQLDPQEADNFDGRANAYLDLHKPDLAIADANQAISLSPDFAQAYGTRGSVYMMLQDYVRAAPDFEQAIKLKPDYAEAISNRGSVDFAQVDYAQAIVWFNKALAADPHYALALHNRASAKTELGDAAGAAADEAAARAINPSVGIGSQVTPPS